MPLAAQRLLISLDAKSSRRSPALHHFTSTTAGYEATKRFFLNATGNKPEGTLCKPPSGFEMERWKLLLHYYCSTKEIWPMTGLASSAASPAGAIVMVGFSGTPPFDCSFLARSVTSKL